MNRRSFLLGAGLFVAAPAIIRTAGLLMPVKPLPLGKRDIMDAILEGRFTPIVYGQVREGEVVVGVFRIDGATYRRRLVIA